jgi:hypothetical protein
MPGFILNFYIQMRPAINGLWEVDNLYVFFSLSFLFYYFFFFGFFFFSSKIIVLFIIEYITDCGSHLHSFCRASRQLFG